MALERLKPFAKEKVGPAKAREGLCRELRCVRKRLRSSFLLTTIAMSLLRPQSQDGQDTPGKQSSKGKILLSIVGSDGLEHYAVIAMPESYEVICRSD